MFNQSSGVALRLTCKVFSSSTAIEDHLPFAAFLSPNHCIFAYFSALDREVKLIGSVQVSIMLQSVIGRALTDFHASHRQRPRAITYLNNKLASLKGYKSGQVSFAGHPSKTRPSQI